MFIGSYHHSIDEKGRVKLPADFRSDFKKQKEKSVIMKGFEPHLALFTPESWINYYEKNMAGRDEFEKDTRDLKRRLLSDARQIKVDSQGRFVIPPELRKHIGLKNTVVVVGVGDHIELWNDVEWSQYNHS